MKFVSKLMCAVGLALAATTAAQAGAVINDWYFNRNGTGAAGAVKIHENLDFVGQGMIVLTPTGGGNFSFTEYAAFAVVGRDGLGNSLPGPNYISSTFVGTGTGSFSGAFSFNSGTLNLFTSGSDGSAYAYAGGATNIGSFSVLPGGGGLVDGSGNPTGNGQVTVNMQASSLAAGYWFDPAKNPLVASDTLAFAFTNANPVQNPDPADTVSPLCTLAGFGPTCAGAPAGSAMLFVGNNGQFKLATVPEPGSLALVGLALVAVGGVRRQKARKQA